MFAQNYYRRLRFMGGTGEQSTITQTVALFRMPLFFFISGFFVYSANYTRALYQRRLANRLKSQLWPTVIFWALFCLGFCDSNFSQSLQDHFKSGYWFTFVAVELFCIFSPLFLLFTWKDSTIKQRNMILLSFSVLLLALSVIGSKLLGWGTTRLWGILSFSDMFLYMPYFVLGILFKINNDCIMKIITNKFFVIACLIIFFSLLYIPMNALVHIGCAIAGISIIHYLFWRIFQYKSILESRISYLLQYIGTLTLEIYLLHYFIIEALKIIPNINILTGLKNTLFEFPIYLILSSIIIYCCLGCSYLFKILHLNKYLFPKSTLKSPVLLFQSH